MTGTFLLIRHAAHVHLDQRLSGRMPGVALSEAGRAQLPRLAARVAALGPDRLLCSPLDRTRATAEAVASACGLTAEPDEALVELDFGRWTGLAFDEVAGDPDWDRWNAERGTARVPGGESMAEAQARIVGVLAREAAAQPGTLVALVTHSDLIRAAIAHILGLSLDNIGRFDIGPASISRVVYGDWGGRVLALNEGGE